MSDATYTWIICPDCEGGGIVGEDSCEPCYGKGRVPLFQEFRAAVEFLRLSDSVYRDTWAAEDASRLMADTVTTRVERESVA